jgi:hypothetical protein
MVAAAEVEAAVGCGGVGNGEKTVADRKVDGGFNVYGYCSFSRRNSPYTGYPTEDTAFSQLGFA